MNKKMMKTKILNKKVEPKNQIKKMMKLLMSKRLPNKRHFVMS